MTFARQPTDTEAGLERAGLRVSVSAEGLRPNARARLVNLLLAKAAFDLLFVCALAAAFYYAAFRPTLRGSLDHADAESVRGWVVDKSEPSRRVEVQLYLDGQLAGAGLADRPRPDVSARGLAEDDRHGFVFELGTLPPGEHEARVYALHTSAAGRRRTLQQIGGAIRFESRQ